MGRIDQQSTPEIGTPVASQPHVPTSLPNPQTGSIGIPWNSGLFDCHLDQTNAVMTAFFPCITFGHIAEVLDGSDPSQGSQISCAFGSVICLLMSASCMQCVIASKYRKKLRTRYGLVEAPYEDAITHLFCPFCSLCQEFRELKSRNLDPSLGWKGIQAQQQGMQNGNAQMNQPPQFQSMSM